MKRSAGRACCCCCWLAACCCCCPSEVLIPAAAPSTEKEAGRGVRSSAARTRLLVVGRTCSTLAPAPAAAPACAPLPLLLAAPLLTAVPPGSLRVLPAALGACCCWPTDFTGTPRPPAAGGNHSLRASCMPSGGTACAPPAALLLSPLLPSPSPLFSRPTAVAVSDTLAPIAAAPNAEGASPTAAADAATSAPSNSNASATLRLPNLVPSSSGSPVRPSGLPSAAAGPSTVKHSTGRSGAHPPCPSLNSTAPPKRTLRFLPLSTVLLALPPALLDGWVALVLGPVAALLDEGAPCSACCPGACSTCSSTC